MADAVTYDDGGFFIFNVGAELTPALGLLGLTLAVIGMYGVTAYAVGQRTQEIGVRIALGAQRATILWMIAREGLATIGLGLVLGVLMAISVGRLVRDFLVGIGPVDPLTYLSVSALLTFIGLAACYVPARHAMRVDPTTALRHE
jgi:putative ABC transport system permease protein